MQQKQFTNAYTDAPDLNAHGLVGSLQLVGWLFFHPSAFHHYAKRMMPGLRSDFGLADLSWTQWRENSALRHLLIKGYVIIPVLTSLIVGLLLWPVLSLAKPPDTVALHIITGVVCGALISVVCGIVIGLAYGMRSVAVGIGVGMTSSIVNGLTVGIVSGGAFETYSVAIGVLGGFFFSVAGSLAKTLVVSKVQSATSKQIGGSLIGSVVGSMLFSVIFMGIRATSTLMDNLMYTAAMALIVGGGVGSAVGLAAGVHMHDRQRGLAAGITVGTVLTLTSLALHITTFGTRTPPTLTQRLIFTTLLATEVSPVFLLPYVWVEQRMGPIPGAVAAALSSGGLWGVIFAVESRYPLLTLLLNGLGILVGLTFPLWRPVVLYPLFAAWNLLLYQFDTCHNHHRPSLLRWHAAFWDENQPLPWSGLDEYLLLILEHTPDEGQAAMAYLTYGHQRWAAQAAQIELDAQSLERCIDVQAIKNVHAKLAASQLVGPAEALFKCFAGISHDVAAAACQENVYNRRQTFDQIAMDLENLLHELTRSSERYAERFRPIAKRWHAIISAHIQTLTDTLAQSQAIDNPYTFGTPLTKHQEIFVGRADICARIERLLLEQRCPPLLLYGQRRMGKTSLLNNLGRLLPHKIVPFFVDLQGPATLADTYSGFLYHIIQEMVHSAAKERNLKLATLSREVLMVDPFIHFDAWLTDMETALTDRVALLALDEFEALDAALVQGRFEADVVLGMLRHLIQHRPRFKIIIAGSHSLDEFQRWASYLINVQVMHISYLSETEARQLIEQPIKHFDLHYTPEAVQRVIDLTRGHPALIQLLCYEIVSLKNEQPLTTRGLAQVADVAAAVPRALTRGSLLFSGIQHSQLDSAEAETVLRFMAQHGEGATISQQTLTQQFSNDLSGILRSLVRRELIEATDTGYRFQVELIRRWFAQREGHFLSESPQPKAP